jgi:tRNA 2-thiouridine synthesizing protein E
MVSVKVTMKSTGVPLKRTLVVIEVDGSGERLQVSTDRAGTASFDIGRVSGKILVDGVPRYHGPLEGEIPIELWSVVEGAAVKEAGAPGANVGGSTAYPSMQTKTLLVDGREVLTDGEGYLVNLDDWSEGFVRVQATKEGLGLTNEHWEVIRFLREYFDRHHVQAQVREIIKHFKRVWGAEKGSNRYLHDLFPSGGPQKQGNRLAGLLRTKGEH